jgi:hypothetical protein
LNGTVTEVKQQRTIHLAFSDIDSETIHLDYDLNDVSSRDIAIAIVNLFQELGVPEGGRMLTVLDNIHSKKIQEAKGMLLINSASTLLN